MPDWNAAPIWRPNPEETREQVYKRLRPTPPPPAALNRQLFVTPSNHIDLVEDHGLPTPGGFLIKNPNVHALPEFLAKVRLVRGDYSELSKESLKTACKELAPGAQVPTLSKNNDKLIQLVMWLDKIVWIYTEGFKTCEKTSGLFMAVSHVMTLVTKWETLHRYWSEIINRLTDHPASMTWDKIITDFYVTHMDNSQKIQSGKALMTMKQGTMEVREYWRALEEKARLGEVPQNVVAYIFCQGLNANIIERIDHSQCHKVSYEDGATMYKLAEAVEKHLKDILSHSGAKKTHGGSGEGYGGGNSGGFKPPNKYQKNNLGAKQLSPSTKFCTAKPKCLPENYDKYHFVLNNRGLYIEDLVITTH